VSLFRPAPPHNPLLGPAVCLCVDCCRIMAKLRCPVTSANGHQCGSYKNHRGKEHSLLVMTVFQIVDERLAEDRDESVFVWLPS
jgi:hypothetical protein